MGTRLVQYEARLNEILPKHDTATVCSYDVTRFRSSVLMDILRTHPLVIVGGALQRNPFYVEPEEFLRELSERVRLPDEDTVVAKSQLFILEEDADYMVDEGGTAPRDKLCRTIAVADVFALDLVLDLEPGQYRDRPAADLRRPGLSAAFHRGRDQDPETLRRVAPARVDPLHRWPAAGSPADISIS